MVSWLPPINLKELRGFFGINICYRKFVAGYARIALPLTEQLKKDKIWWNNEVVMAFEELKSYNFSIILVLVLTMLDFSRSFIIETNALGFGLGAVLLQLTCSILLP